MCVCVYIRVCVYTCVCVCINSFMEREWDLLSWLKKYQHICQYMSHLIDMFLVVVPLTHPVLTLRFFSSECIRLSQDSWMGKFHKQYWPTKICVSKKQSEWRCQTQNMHFAYGLLWQNSRHGSMLFWENATLIGRLSSIDFTTWRQLRISNWVGEIWWILLVCTQTGI